jgi:hypothetical protein
LKIKVKIVDNPADSSLSNSAALPDLALQPPRVTAEFDPDTVKSTRGAQGVPAIERAANGRLWAAWYAGPSPRGVESSRSYVVLATSGDDGVTWSEQLLVRARRFVHTYDPCLWIDPQRRLWFFWAQSAGVQDARNQRLIDLVAEHADRRQIPEHTLRTNTLSVRMVSGRWSPRTPTRRLRSGRSRDGSPTESC